jgi:hypothetical protein
MSITTIEHTATISTTPYSLYFNTAVAGPVTGAPGVYQVFIDTSNLDTNTAYGFGIYEAAVSGGVAQSALSEVLTINDDALYVSPPLALVNGFDFIMVKLRGTDTSFGWSIRKVG